MDTKGAYLQDISAEILMILDLQRNPLSLGRYRGTRLDLIVSIAAFITVHGHDEDVL